MQRDFSTTIGLDLGDKRSQVYVLDNETAEGLEEAKVPTNTRAFQRYFTTRTPALVVLEVGTHSSWVSRLLAQMGHGVLVADPRKVRNLMGDDDKDDKLDAEFLARIGRSDPKLLKPIKHRSEQTQAALAILRARDCLVRSRTQQVNHVRGVVKSTGEKLARCSTDSFHRLEPQLPESLRRALAPTMQCIAEMNKTIRRYDKLIQDTINAEYPEATLLMAIDGVGPITALTYVLVIEYPARFNKSRTVGAYLGLCRRRWKSGDSDPELCITKRGDRLLRRLLITCAQHILGPFGHDSDLRRWGMAYAARGGKKAKKRAVVGVARRLSVVMHKLWSTGAAYDPLFNARRRGDVAKTAGAGVEAA